MWSHTLPDRWCMWEGKRVSASRWSPMASTKNSKNEVVGDHESCIVEARDRRYTEEDASPACGEKGAMSDIVGTHDDGDGWWWWERENPVVSISILMFTEQYTKDHWGGKARWIQMQQIVIMVQSRWTNVSMSTMSSVVIHVTKRS